VFNQRVILFGSGGLFSASVLDGLVMRGLKPVALVLPGFAPAKLTGLGTAQVEVGRKVNRFVSEAKRLEIPLIYMPQVLQTSQVEKIALVKADFILVACWPYLLSPEIVKAADKVALNLHPSMLPNYRGANPVTEQIDRHEKNLGVSLHVLSQEFDKGDIVAQARLVPGTGFPGRELIEVETAQLGTNLFLKAIQDYGGSLWKPVSQ